MMLQILIVSYCKASVSGLSEGATNRPSRNMLSQRDALRELPSSNENKDLQEEDTNTVFEEMKKEHFPMVEYLDRK